MNEPAASPATDVDAPVRSTQGVLLLLAAILVIPLVALLVAFAPRGGSGAGEAVLESVDSDRVQAVYLTTDLVYFGLVTEAEGDFFLLKDAFFLRENQPEGADENTEAEDAGLVPVPVSQEVGGDGDLLVNANEVLRIQTLTEDSEIASAIEVGDG